MECALSAGIQKLPSLNYRCVMDVWIGNNSYMFAFCHCFCQELIYLWVGCNITQEEDSNGFDFPV